MIAIAAGPRLEGAEGARTTGTLVEGSGAVADVSAAADGLCFFAASGCGVFGGPGGGDLAGSALVDADVDEEEEEDDDARSESSCTASCPNSNS